MVCSRHPCVSWMRRDFHRTMGAMIHAHVICQKMDGHHSQPTACLAFFSSGVPVTSVPGAPKPSWNFRETRNIMSVRENCRNVSGLGRWRRGAF